MIKFEEMAIRVISSVTDNLPFRVSIKAPDHLPPHAHLMDKETGKKEIGRFIITERKPGSSSDIKDYKQGINDEQREIVFKWASQSHKILTKQTNWEVLWFEWKMNEIG
jgi:hypothetical protein